MVQSPKSADRKRRRVLRCYNQFPHHHRIRINTLTPGWVMTERQVRLWLDAAGEQEIAHNQCLPDKLLPHHVASMVLFLASDDSAMCTAQEFVVDGGWT